MSALTLVALCVACCCYQNRLECSHIDGSDLNSTLNSRESLGFGGYVFDNVKWHENSKISCSVFEGAFSVDFGQTSCSMVYKMLYGNCDTVKSVLKYNDTLGSLIGALPSIATVTLTPQTTTLDLETFGWRPIKHKIITPPPTTTTTTVSTSTSTTPTTTTTTAIGLVLSKVFSGRGFTLPPIPQRLDYSFWVIVGAVLSGLSLFLGFLTLFLCKFCKRRRDARQSYVRSRQNHTQRPHISVVPARFSLASEEEEMETVNLGDDDDSVSSNELLVSSGLTKTRLARMREVQSGPFVVKSRALHLE